MRAAFYRVFSETALEKVIFAPDFCWLHRVMWTFLGLILQYFPLGLNKQSNWSHWMQCLHCIFSKTASSFEDELQKAISAVADAPTSATLSDWCFGSSSDSPFSRPICLLPLVTHAAIARDAKRSGRRKYSAIGYNASDRWLAVNKKLSKVSIEWQCYVTIPSVFGVCYPLRLSRDERDDLNFLATGCIFPEMLVARVDEFWWGSVVPKEQRFTEWWAPNFLKSHKI